MFYKLTSSLQIYFVTKFKVLGDLQNSRFIRIRSES